VTDVASSEPFVATPELPRGLAVEHVVTLEISDKSNVGTAQADAEFHVQEPGKPEQVFSVSVFRM
jgi:hypothetical protein